MQRLKEPVKSLANSLTSLFDRANKSRAFLMLFILVLTLAMTIPVASRQIKQELWTIVSMNVADNLLSGNKLVSTIDPAVGTAYVSPLLWPGPVAIIWTTLWKAAGLPWMIEPALAFICILLIGLLMRRIDSSMSLIAVTICALHHQLLSSIHSEHDLMLSLALILSAVLLISRQNANWLLAFVTALLSLLGFLTNPIWLPALIFLPLACGKETSRSTRLLMLVGFIAAIALLALLKATELLNPLLQLHQISDLPLKRAYSALIPLWMYFVSKPLVFAYLLFCLHGFRERKKSPYQQTIFWLSILSVVLLLIAPFSYYSITFMDIHSYGLLLLFVSLPVAGFGFKRILAALSLEDENRARLFQLLFFLAIVYIMGVNMIQKQISQAVYFSDNAATIEQKRAALQAARDQLSPHEWLLIVDGWDMASGMSNVIIPNTMARQTLTKRAMLQAAHPFSGVFFSETTSYAYNIRLPDSKDLSSWTCVSKGGYRFCKKP